MSGARRVPGRQPAPLGGITTRTSCRGPRHVAAHPGKATARYGPDMDVDSQERLVRQFVLAPPPELP